MVILAFLGVLLVASGLVLLFRVRHGAALVLEVWRRPTCAISAIQPGVVELSGKLSPVGEPVFGLSRPDNVAVKTQVIGFSGEGKQRKNLGGRSTLRAGRALLQDATGTCVIDLDDAEIVGEFFSMAPAPLSHFEEDLPPWARDLAPPSATHLAVEEVVVPSGAEVMVTAVTRKQEKNQALYRDAGARWELGGTEERRVLVTVGGQKALFRRTGGAVAVAAIAGVCLIVQGVATILVGIWL